MKYLSFFLREDTPSYGGVENTLEFKQINSISKGDTSNNLHLSLPNHIGTHIDFPRHFNNDGKTCSDYPADFWVFSKVGFLACTIAEVPQKLDQLPADIELLILKTGFGAVRGERAYWAEQPVIPSGFAELFKRRFPLLRVFGFDLISLTSKLDRAEGKEAHIRFLIQEEILVLEDMDLSMLISTPKIVIILPLQVASADGVPCTVIAI